MQAPAYPRNLRRHGRDGFHARWPGAARIAVQLVRWHEEGGENQPLHDAFEEIHAEGNPFDPATARVLRP